MQIHGGLPKTILTAAERYNRRHPGRISSIEDERVYAGAYRDRATRRTVYSGAPYWMYTAKGYCDGSNPGCHTITCYSVAEFLDSLKSIEPCTCDECSS